MNSREFVDVISQEVFESAIRGVKEQLLKPSGRSPDRELVEMSNWFNGLDDMQRRIVSNLITMSAKDAVANFLGVLDGLIAIENEDKGILKLYYERRNEKVLLNDQENLNLQEYFL